MAPRKPVIHRKQKSHEAPPRRSTGKPTKHREERLLAKSPAALAIDLQVPKALREILLNSRAQIKNHDKVLKLPKEYRSPPPATEDEEGKKERTKKPPKRESGEPYPGPPNVRETLEQFTDLFLSMPGKSLHQSVDDIKLIPVITRGILVYFEKTLATNLLYVEERGQYAFLDNKYRSGTSVQLDLEEDKNICSWYGSDHLLRLLVMLPEMLTQSSVDDYSAEVVGIYLKHLLDWLDEHRERLFLPISAYVVKPHYYTTDIRSRSHAGGLKGEGTKAYISMLLHAAKHPHQAINGVLLAAPVSGDEVLIERTIPLLHHWTGLSPMMEIGLDLATSYANEAGLRIYGYYQAIPSVQTQGPGPVGEKILAKLRQTTPDAFGLLIALDGLSSKAPLDTPGLSAIPPVQLSLRNRQSPTRTIELISSGLQSNYADFDDHLENVRLDWLENPACADKDWSA